MSNSKNLPEKKPETVRRCLLCKKELLPGDWKLCDGCARGVYGKASKFILGVTGMLLGAAANAKWKK